MPTGATGDGLCGPLSKSRPTTESSGWARWAAAGESAEAVFRAMKEYLMGHDPARLEEMRFLIANPTASLYNNRTQVLAALEFACLDILGQAWGVPVSEILGGRLRDRVALRHLLVLPLSGSANGAGRSAHHRAGAGVHSRHETAVRLHHAQGEGGSIPSGLRAGTVPRGGGGVSGRFAALRPQRGVVHRAGHPLRAGHRGITQRLPGRSRVTG